MKATYNTIRSDIRNMATSGSNPIDFRIPDSQIEFWIDQVRSKLISQSIQNRKDITTVWVQILPCLALQHVDISECCDLPSGCKVLRTTLQVPRTVETSADNSILKVTDSNGKIIPRTSENGAKYDEFNKYTSTQPKWYEKNMYIYVINTDTLTSINVHGIFESPMDLADYESCTGDTCFDENDEYPCSLKMASDITDIVYKTKVLPFMNLPQDNSNDSANITTTPPTNKQ